MRKRISKILTLGCAAAVLTSCSSEYVPSGKLGFNDSRRVVIVGENVRPDIAMFYQREYAAPVWYTPYKGSVAHVADNLLESGLAPSHPMRSLINELKSINYTIGRWEIIIPKVGEKYFYKTLKNMQSGALSKARGMVILIDSSGFPQIEKEVERVSSGSFFVTYELHKDIK